MGVHLMRWFGRRGRRHPIKRDQSGKSARRRAFDLFDQGMRPLRVAPLVGIPHRTAYRYFQQWKKQPRYLEAKYRVIKAALGSRQVGPKEFAEALAEVIDMPPERVLEELDKPWGLKRLLSGRLHHLDKAGIQRKTLARLDAALKLVHMYEATGIAPERIMEELDRLKDREKASTRPAAPGDNGQAG